MAKNYAKIVADMTLEQRRARLAEITRRATAGDFGWDYDECVHLESNIPEEKAARDKAFAARAKRKRTRRTS